MYAKELEHALSKAYAALSPYSDHSKWEYHNHLTHLKNIVHLLQGLSRETSIIDIGCHIGILAIALRIVGYNAEANDKYIFEPKSGGNTFGYTEKELDDIKRIWHTYGLQVHHYDAIKDRPTKQYDLVISIATIEHQPYPKPFIDNLAAFAAKEGYIYIATPNIARMVNRIRFCIGRPPMSNLEDFYLHPHTFTGHYREYTLREIQLMGTLSGLEIYSKKVVQAEPARFTMNNTHRWPSNVARILSKFFYGTGDSICVIFRKG